MYALLPILAFLATANALPVAVNNEVAAVEKRACLFGIVCLDGGSGSASSSSSSAKASSTSTSASASSTSSSASASKSSSSSSASSSSSSSASKASTTSAAASSTGNIVQSVVAAPSQVVSAVLKCPLDPLGVLGLCQDANTGASSSASASKASTTASSSAAAGNVVSSIIAVPSAVVSGAVSVVAPVVSSAVAIPSAVVSQAVSVVAPVVSSAVVVPSAVVSQAVSVVAPVVSSAVVVPSAVVSQAVSVVAPVVSSAVVVPSAVVSQAVSVVAPVVSSAVAVPSAIVSSAVSVAQPAASSVSSVVAPIVSVIVPGPAASSVSSIIASVTASSSSAAAASSSSAVTSVTPTTTAAASSSASPSASAAPTNAAVANWGYTACVQEGTNGRALTGSTFAGSGMTVESCLASCDASGFMYAGLEYSSECYCGSTLANGASVAKTGTCDMPCSGNSKQICGGSATLSLYTSTKAAAAQPAALPAGWSSTTCMQEVSGRAFTKKSTASDDMTIAKCLSFCGDSKYAGIEYGRECYCADTLSNGASLASTSGQCNTPCAGAPSQTCGGPDALQVYTNGNYKTASAGAYTNTGCVQEVDGRLLRGASIAGDNMTIETCTSFCQSQGMSIAGLEYARECYCGNSYVSSPLQSGQCNMPCAGNANENCGGPNALNIFTLA